MANKNKKIIDVDFTSSLNGNESFFINQDNAIKQINKNNIYLSHDHKAESIKPTCIELSPSSNSNHGGYIDFHYNGSSADYTSRIIEAGNGNVTLNGNKILTKGDVVDIYNLTLSFVNGVATYENSAIKYASVVLVQRRGNIANANLSFCTTTHDGVVTITTDSSVNGSIAVNMIITYL